jgi:ParB family transcriptional regulator, chromosome partitioning protein
MIKKRSFGIGMELDQALTETVNSVELSAKTGRLDFLPVTKVAVDPNNPRTIKVTKQEALKLRAVVKDNIESLTGDEAIKILVENQEEWTDAKIKDLDSLITFARGIKRQGLINPINTYSHGSEFRIITGERRFLASVIAGLDPIKTIIHHEKPTDLAKTMVQWAENVDRDDLSLIDRINNLKQITIEYKKVNGGDITSKVLSDILGCSLRLAYDYSELLHLDQNLMDLIQAGQLDNIKKVAQIAKTKPNMARERVIKAYKSDMTLPQLRSLIALSKQEVDREKIKGDLSAVITGKSRKGRQPTKINLGSTTNAEAVKFIIQTILNETGQKDRDLETILLDSKPGYKALSQAFGKLLKNLEKR